MKEKAMSKEKAALALARLAEEHLKTCPEEERKRIIKAFGSKVSELRKKSANFQSLAQLHGVVGKP